MNPKTLFDLRQRFNNTYSDYNHKPYSQHKKPITDMNVDDTDYERPFWVAPDLDSEQGNIFSLTAIVSEHLKSLGYTQEANEFKEIIFENMKNKKNITIFQTIDKFLNYFDSISEKTIDGESYVKIEKQKKEFQQLSEFKNVTLESVKKLFSENFNFNTTNIYGRSILFYVKDRNTLEWIFNNVYDINKSEDYVKLFQLDVFNTSLLINYTKDDMIDFILEKMITKEKDFSQLITKWCVGVDSFSRCMEDSIVKNLNMYFSNEDEESVNLNSTFTNLDSKIIKIAKLFSKVNKFYPEFTNSIINTGSLAFKDNPKKLKLWKTNMEKKYLEQLLQDSKPDNESMQHKKLKI